MADYDVGLRFRSDSRDIRKSTKDLDRMERQSKKTSKAAAGLGRAFAGVTAALSAGLIARAVIRNTIEQERVTAQLNAVLKSTGKFSKEVSDGLLEQAKAFQQLTIYGDEAVIGAQNVLLTFRRIGQENFPRATEATLDLATAMGTDLKSAALQVGKALEDPATQMGYLSRAGITFTQQQKDLVRELQRTGDLAGAQAIVLKELETQFGGSARAARDTFGGALKGVQNAFGDLLEADGDNLTGAISALNELEAVLQSPGVKQGLADLTEGMIKFVGVLAQIPGTVGFLKDELLALFGVVADDDFTRRMDEIAGLQEQLNDAVENSVNIFGMENRMWAARAESLRREIREKQALLDLDMQFADAQRRAANPPELDSLPTAVASPGAVRREVDIFYDEDGFDQMLDELEAAGAASDSLRQTLNALAAEVGGPVVQASQTLAETLASLDEYERALIEAGQLTLDKEQQLASARALATQQYEERIRLLEEERLAQEAALSPAEQMIANLEREIELIGLSNVERERALALQLAGKDATQDEIDTINELINTKARANEAEAILNDVRAAGEDALASFISGTASASEAFENFADDLIQQASRILAQKAIEAIFGAAFGGGGLGSGGGLFGTFADSLFGPGRALGGPVYPGRLHPIVERGEPEMLTIGRDNYLLTGERGGKVTPVSKTTNNRQTTNNIIVQAVRSDKTLAQTASKVAREQSRYERRNR